ncbi:MAG: hypothetical protein JNG89_02920 [Planctomycetaceae bacterium]|nr:hypothetical protein [Planctomycetaceae bacterium]
MSLIAPLVAARAPIAATPATRGRRRPPLLRALGNAEPPLRVEIAGVEFQQLETFKHDSWAATALYESHDGRQVVCKFNRIQPVFGLPMRWLGRLLARRERLMLERLANEPLVPDGSGDVLIDGNTAHNCVAHEFVPGRPLARRMPLSPEFFDELDALLARVHEHGVAYVDLHKRENILVGVDGRPYLIDFQISMRLSDAGLAGAVLHALQRCDRYHLAKHVRRGAIDGGAGGVAGRDVGRPWIIRLHRRIAVPLRGLRRQLLVWLRVRTPGGRAHTEVDPEVGSLQWTGL